MALVNSMYQYSLASFLELFDFSLRRSQPDSILSRRLNHIMNTLTHNVYNYGCTGKGSEHLLTVILLSGAENTETYAKDCLYFTRIREKKV